MKANKSERLIGHIRRCLRPFYLPVNLKVQVTLACLRRILLEQQHPHKADRRIPVGKDPNHRFRAPDLGIELIDAIRGA